MGSSQIKPSPGGVERYFDESFALLSREVHWPPHDMSAYEKLALKHDTYLPGESVLQTLRIQRVREIEPK